MVTCEQYLTVHLHCRLPAELVTSEVCVVRALDEIMRQGMVHVLEYKGEIHVISIWYLTCTMFF